MLIPRLDKVNSLTTYAAYIMEYTSYKNKLPWSGENF